jgi:RND family efflux transporter MFP subunit
MIKKAHCLVLGVLLLSGCTRNKNIADTVLPKARVTVHTVQPRTFSSDITSFGSIVYTRKNDITTAVEGIIESLPAREGTAVGAGTVLVQLSNIQLSINYEQARSAYASARASTTLMEEQYRDYRMQLESRFLTLEKMELEIQQTIQQLELMKNELSNTEILFSVGGITSEQLRAAHFSFSSAQNDYEKLKKEREIMLIGMRDADIAAAGLAVPQDNEKRRQLLIELNSRTKKAELMLSQRQEETAKTQMTSAEALLNELVITCPATGIVGAVYKELGERIEPGEKILTVIDSRTAWAVFPVNEKDIGRITKGMPATVQIEALGDQTIQAVIDVVSATVDPQSGNVTVKALLDNPGNSGKPGMFAKITVPTDIPTERVFIPQTCLAQRNGDQGIVVTVRNNRVFQRKVQLGLEHQNEIEITEGLQNGELVIIDPTPLLKEGDEVVLHEKT